jgi:Caspase domain
VRPCSNYMWGGEPPLKEPINDARSLGEELKRDGFDVDVRENLSKEAMQRAIDGFYGKLRTGMTGLIFFSGYGIQANRQSYLIPVDVDIFNESEVRPNGISLDNVLAEMNRRGAGVKIAIIDAARRFNPFENRFRRPGAGLAPVSSPGGTLVMYSATAGTPGGARSRQQRPAGLVRRRVAQGDPRAGRVRRGSIQPHPHGCVPSLLERPESMDLVLAEPGILVLELQQAPRIGGGLRP